MGIDEDTIETQTVRAALEGLSNLEKDFAAVELDALRSREYSLRELYARRQTLLASIPSFWSTILPHGPDAFTACLTERDPEILDTIKSLNVERYQIKSESEGEPRSLRFTFEFHSNNFFEDEKVVKEFEYDVGKGGYVSAPVGFKWTAEGKKTGLGKLLDLAVDLYSAEIALVGKGKEITDEERKGLWQYEKLREAIEKSEEAEDGTNSFLEWFGFRGAVGETKEEKNGQTEDDEDEEDDFDSDAMLEVEIFPAGEEVAIALGEDLWENVMDHFMQAQAEDDDLMEELDGEDEDDEEGEDGAPELVEAENFEGFEDERPAKKQKTG